MTTRTVHRPARVVRPLTAPPAIHLAAPPQLAEGSGGVGLQAMLPVLGDAGSMTMLLVQPRSPMVAVIGALVLLTSIGGGAGAALSQRGSAARGRRAQRERYLDYLETLRSDLRAAELEARATSRTVHPEPSALVDIVRNPARRWERRRGDADFLDLRVGVGERPWVGLALPPDPDPAHPFDPAMASEATAVVRRFARVRELPVTVPLDCAGEVAVIGSRGQVLEVGRALLTQAVALHAPDDVGLAVAFPAARVADWEWLGALPHLIDAALLDGPVPARRVAGDLAGLARVLGPNLAARARAAARSGRGGLGGLGGSGGATAALGPRLVVVADEHGQTAGTLPTGDPAFGLAELGACVVHLLADRLDEPSDVALRLTVDSDGVVTVEDLRTGAGPAASGPEASGPAAAGCPPTVAAVDEVSTALAVGLVRALAPLRLSADDARDTAQARTLGVDELLGIGDVASIEVTHTWAGRSSRDFLRVPIGLDDAGAPLLLDLKESAQLGMGPHGLCVGATGSGKSELLRTLVAALALSHPPDDLAMILVDYKGGAAFAPFAALPHVAGIIDNLADDAGRIERARASIAGEVLRRQRMLRDAGGSPSITHYRELRAQGVAAPTAEHRQLGPMPHLLLVIDEFAELLTSDPDFVDLLVTIGRIGRSIGMHLLLASQRLESGRLRGLETHLSYRLGLRTFTAVESSAVLDTPDAFHLPAVPGYGYLKVDSTVYQRFRAGYVSGPVRSAGIPAPEPAPGSALRRPLLLPVHHGVIAVNGLVDAAGSGEPELARASIGAPMVDAVVHRLADAAPPTRPVWLTPLPARVSLSEVLARGGAPGSAPARGHLRVPLGLLDDPARQRQVPWVLDLTRAGGHVALIGAPQTGRTTALWTLAASLASTHTPRQVAIYGMDLDGGGLSRIEGFPHVGGVATRGSRDRLRRLLEELHGMLAVRERTFAQRGIDSLETLRARHAAGAVPELATADIVLLIDGIGALRSDADELDEPVGVLLQRGGGFGIHVVATMTRWNELRMSSQAFIGTRLELRLNDPGDSTIGRALAATLRPDQPGRALTDQRLFAQVAVPDAGSGLTTGEGLAELARRSAREWRGPLAPPIRLLSVDLAPTDLPDALDEPDLVPIGVRQDTMGPALLDLAGRDQHLVVLGDAACGKTTLLRGIVAGLVERAGPDELVIALYDVRGTLAGTCPDDYLGGRATSGPLALELSAAIAGELARRSRLAAGAGARGGPPPALGPRIVVVVDDYDVLAAGGADPLRALVPHLPAARDLDLHVVVARPVAGAARASYDPVLQALRDSGGSVFLMTGERSEGQVLGGSYAEPLPPGRGRLLRRGDPPRLIQVAHFTEGSPDAP